MNGEYTKNFDEWNTLKKKVDIEEKEVYGYPREVWWCSLGVNVGAEIDGKNESFERPVIIMRVYNKETMLVLPTTSKARADRFHFALEVETQNPQTKKMYIKTVYVKLTQARVISNKRLIRKIAVIGEVDFAKIRDAFSKFV